MSEQENGTDFGVWAILELMGHVKLAGYVTEEELFGSKVGRIDIPGDEEEPAVTQYFGGQSVYRLTPVTEDVARAYATGRKPTPVSAWDLPELRELRELRVQLAQLEEGGNSDFESTLMTDDEFFDQEDYYEADPDF